MLSFDTFKRRSLQPFNWTVDSSDSLKCWACSNIMDCLRGCGGVIEWHHVYGWLLVSQRAMIHLNFVLFRTVQCHQHCILTLCGSQALFSATYTNPKHSTNIRKFNKELNQIISTQPFSGTVSGEEAQIGRTNRLWIIRERWELTQICLIFYPADEDCFFVETLEIFTHFQYNHGRYTIHLTRVF